MSAVIKELRSQATPALADEVGFRIPANPVSANDLDSLARSLDAVGKVPASGGRLRHGR